MAKCICIGLVAQLLFFCQRPPMQSSDKDTQVDPETRLAHYLEYHEYPPDSRPADSATADFAELLPSRLAAHGSARIVGWDGAVLRGGSLLVYFQVDVEEAGRYTFQTLLFREQRKLAIATVTRELPPGVVRLPFVFYGRILRKAGLSGPYRLPGIAGERLPTDLELEAVATGKLSRPPEGRLEPLQTPFETEPFPYLSFTEAIWDSPEKRQRVAELQTEVEAYRAARKEN